MARLGTGLGLVFLRNGGAQSAIIIATARVLTLFLVYLASL